MRLSRLAIACVAGLSCSLATAASTEDAVRDAMLKLKPDLPIQRVVESQMPGLYQVELPGGRVLYASKDGRFVIQGYLYEVIDGKTVNHTAQLENRAVAERLAEVDVKDMVVFPAIGEKKAHITVFTDTDCGYCQKLHTEVPELNGMGIEVRYLAYPRQGIGSHAYKTLVNIWCATDRQQAMNLAKARKDVPEAKCDAPVAKQFMLGQVVGIQGTPAIVLADGSLIPGYQPAAELAEAAIEAQKNAAGKP